MVKVPHLAGPPLALEAFLEALTTYLQGVAAPLPVLMLKFQVQVVSGLSQVRCMDWMVHWGEAAIMLTLGASAGAAMAPVAAARAKREVVNFILVVLVVCG